MSLPLNKAYNLFYGILPQFWPLLLNSVFYFLLTFKNSFAWLNDFFLAFLQ